MKKKDEIDVLKVIWDVSMLIRNLSEEMDKIKFLQTPAPYMIETIATFYLEFFGIRIWSRFDPTQHNREHLPKTMALTTRPS
jgi:hypothetical protein